MTLVFNEFKTTYTPTSPNLSVVLMNSEWPYKSGLYTFEKQNLITAYLMSNKIKVYDENPLYYALFDKIVKYEFFNTVFFDSTHVLFGKLEDNKGHANFINKLNISEVSKYLNTEAVLLYYTEESKNKLNYNIVNLSDGKIIASSSANIPKIDKEEDLIKKMITDISQVIPAKKKTIKNNDYLLDSYFTYDGDIIDKDILVATKPIKIVEEKKSEISITKDIYEFKDVKTKPRLKGGMKELNNLVDMFRPKLIKGFANTEFIVDKQGKVKDIIILNSSEVNPILQEAAKLVLNKMEYIPGKDESGNDVNVRMILKISF